MKKILLSLALVTGFTLVNAQNVITADAPKTEESTNVTIDFVSKVVDYGTIEHNADGARKFVFTNNGTWNIARPQFNEVWAPLDGYFFNMGLKIKL
jgi:hypothetical protein